MQNLWGSRTRLTRTHALVSRSLSQHTISRLLSSSSSPPTAAQGTKRRRWSAVLLFLPGLSTFGLGSWQIMRQQWKEELLEHRRSRLREDVVPIDVAIMSARADSTKDNDLDVVRKDAIQSLEYKRVQCEGVFAEEKSIFLGPRGRTNHGVTERGYFLITPLFPAEGENSKVPVLVNRGWVPGSWRDRPPQSTLESSFEDATPVEQGKVKRGILSRLWDKPHETLKDPSEPKIKMTEVVGVIRGSENPNMFVPPNEPVSGQWFFVDVPAMARAVGLPENALYVEAVRDKNKLDFKAKQYPDPKDLDALIRSSVMPADHFSYALTWFTLSAATTFMAWKRISK